MACALGDFCVGVKANHKAHLILQVIHRGDQTLTAVIPTTCMQETAPPTQPTYVPSLLAVAPKNRARLDASSDYKQVRESHRAASQRKASREQRASTNKKRSTKVKPHLLFLGARTCAGAVTTNPDASETRHEATNTTSAL